VRPPSSIPQELRKAWEFCVRRLSEATPAQLGDRLMQVSSLHLAVKVGTLN
jgi:hypothetical protein